MKSTMDDIKEILSRTQTYEDSCEDSLFLLNEQFNELKHNRESEQREMSQRMRAIENDIKRLTASLSEMSIVNTNMKKHLYACIGIQSVIVNVFFIGFPLIEAFTRAIYTIII